MLYYYRYLVKYFDYGTPAGFKLYKTAKEFIGKDASPQDFAPDELGCAETINNIVHVTFGDFAGGDLSTYRMYHAIRRNFMFVEVKKPQPGDIILSPTGYGNGDVKSGHVGIMGYDGKIMSNKSDTGTFEEHWSLDSWIKHYKEKGGFPIMFYRRVFGRL